MPLRLTAKVQEGIQEITEAQEDQEGIQVDFSVYDVGGRLVGDFIPECTVCRHTFFEFGEDYTVAICVFCKKVVARRTDVYPEPDVETEGRKVIGFAMISLGNFKWVCSSCGNDMSALMHDLAITICTECGEVTSRNKFVSADVPLNKDIVLQ